MIGFLRTGIHVLPTLQLETPRLVLRPPRMRDWKPWTRLRERSRDFLVPWEPAWPPDGLTRGAYIRRLRRQIAEWRRDEGYGFLIFDRYTEDLRGGISLSHVRRGVSQSAALGYWIGRDYAGRGYMTEAARAVVGFTFDQLGLHRLEAACLPTNDASIALLESLGFQREGYARAYLRINGAWQDHVLYALVHDDPPHRHH